MIISDFILDSFQEYEGKQSLVLFAKGCNLKCVGCYNYDRIMTHEIGEAIPILDVNLNPMHDAVVLLGGEPTIWDDIGDVCEWIHERGLYSKVFTNGLRPRVIEGLCEKGLLDAISVDFKCLSRFKELLGWKFFDINYMYTVGETIDIAVNHLENVEIRTTHFNEMTQLEVDAVKGYVKDHWANVPHIIQDDFRDMIPGSTR